MLAHSLNTALIHASQSYGGGHDGGGSAAVQPVAHLVDSDPLDEICDGLERNLARLWRFALMRCGDQAQADDLVQATCLRALECAHQYQPSSRLESWLFTILESIWRNSLRAQGIRQGHGLVDIADAQLESRDPDEDTRVRMVDTIRAIGALPANQRTALLLVSVEGFSYDEAARILGLPIGTIMSRISAARTKLRSLCD